MKTDSKLSDYHAKRDFGATSEPRGRVNAKNSASLEFVVQRHAARSLHYDFRLELNGVLKSWAVPKGPSDDPSIKRLAVETEDHPLEYAKFAGDIPPGHYGAGHVDIWDSGTWTPIGDPVAALAKGHLTFELHGARMKGRWALLRIRNERQWLLKKVGEDHHESSAKSNADLQGAGSSSQRFKYARNNNVSQSRGPASLTPMLATLVDRVPVDEGDWAWEIKYDGYRMLCRIGEGQARFLSRNGHEWTDRLDALATRIAKSPLMQRGSGWIDGEVVVFKPDGHSDFQALQVALDGASATPVFVVFDVLQWDGEDFRNAPYVERVAVLDRVFDAIGMSSGLDRSERLEGKVDELWTEACRLGFEGLIGKRLQSSYQMRRSGDWIKLKCRPRQEIVIGGYSDPGGSRSHFGALLVGVREGDKPGGKLRGKLKYAGRVGTGFDPRSLGSMIKRLADLAANTSPFDVASPRDASAIHWVRPELVAEVTFAGWTTDGQLRQASFEGLREDKSASDVLREKAVAPARPTRKDAVLKAHLHASKDDDAPRSSAAPSIREPKVAGVSITHPERVVFRTSKTSKLDLARYYERVAAAFFPEVDRRPLSLLRCPDGADAKCFFQKHLQEDLAGVTRVDIVGGGSATKSGEPDAKLVVQSIAGVIGLVQRGVIEFHTWGSRTPRIDRADRITIDLDPDDGVAWPQVIEAAQLTRALFDELGMKTWLKTTGGKGLHVVTPIKATHDWPAVKDFAHRIASHLARVFPERFIATMSKSARKNRIFIDYLRNAEEATAVAAWSVRARDGAPVSMPLLWNELDPKKDVRLDHFNLSNAHERLASTAQKEWSRINAEAVVLTKVRLSALASSA